VFEVDRVKGVAMGHVWVVDVFLDSTGAEAGQQIDITERVAEFERDIYEQARPYIEAGLMEGVEINYMCPSGWQVERRGDRVFVVPES